MKLSAKELFSITNLSYNKEAFRETVHNISNVLTKVGFEVDSIEFEEDSLKGFFIANVEECKKHPESSKLSICKINTGKEVLQVLCGAPNVRTGINVILATQGAIIPKNGMVIQKTKLAGYESQGMICSADELGLGQNDGSIIELDISTKVGMQYCDYINKNDAILEIAITPNRGDAISYTGIARELVAQGIGSISPLELKVEVVKPLNVEILEEGLANSIFFGKISDISYAPKVQEVLAKCGISSTKIPAVDVLNYTTELHGQPMHLYDFSKIKGTIRIRKSIAGEKLITISGQEIELQGEDIVIADDEKILSLAGIIGDARSSVSSDTKEFILESCSFNRDFIFKSIRKYNIHTAASFRFERYVDSGNAKTFPQKLIAQKFAYLIKNNFSHTFELQSSEIPTVIVCSTPEIAKTLGFEVPFQQIIEILTKLGFECFGDAGNFTVKVPSFRKADVKNINDIIEEIIRSIGVEACPRKNLEIVASRDVYSIYQIKQNLAQSLNEIITFPFVSEKDFTLFDSKENAIKLANSLNEETPYMRSSLVPSMLHNIATAQNLSCNSSALFEISKVFGKNKEQVEICIARSGFSSINTPLQKEREYTIFDVKEDILFLIESVCGLKRESIIYKPITHNAFHPHQGFEMVIGRSVIATIAQIHPLVCEEYCVKNKSFVGTIYLGNIPVKTQKSSVKSGYKQPHLPNVQRELSIVVANEINCLEILRSLQKITKNRFTASIVDIFQNDELQTAGKKSILLAFELFQPETTLNSQEIESIMNESISTLQESVQAVLRGNA